MDDGVLHAEVRAPTGGWVAVGLNDRAELAGSLLVMAAVRDGELVVEEHIAQPPDHPRRQDLGGTPGLVSSEGHESEGATTVRFSLKLDTGDSVAPKLRAGDRIGLTLAWSRDDDFGHHSARRELVPVEL